LLDRQVVVATVLFSFSWASQHLHRRTCKQHLNIQVDNPVVCMSQKTAKEFLVNNDPARFYAFFLKATQIDKLIEAVRQAEDLKDQVLTTLEDYEFGFQEFLAKDYAPAKQAHEDLAEAREVVAQKRMVEKERCNRWIQDEKAKIKDLAAQKEKADENEKKALAKLEEHKADQKSNQDRLQMFKVIEHTCTAPLRKL